jgi:hypothetical protein
MLERRRHPRQPAKSLGSWRRAKIDIPGGASIECSIYDISWGGACLLVGNAVDLPETFDLVIELNGARERCRVIWKDRGKVGVSFAENGRNEADLGRSIRATPQVRDLLALQTCLSRLARPLRALKALMGHRR